MGMIKELLKPRMAIIIAVLMIIVINKNSIMVMLKLE